VVLHTEVCRDFLENSKAREGFKVVAYVRLSRPVIFSTDEPRRRAQGGWRDELPVCPC
jgi:hypothetical protein